MKNLIKALCCSLLIIGCNTVYSTNSINIIQQHDIQTNNIQHNNIINNNENIYENEITEFISKNETERAQFIKDYKINMINKLKK